MRLEGLADGAKGLSTPSARSCALVRHPAADETGARTAPSPRPGGDHPPHPAVPPVNSVNLSLPPGAVGPAPFDAATASTTPVLDLSVAPVRRGAQQNSPGDGQDGTTGVLRAGTSARTDLSMPRCARTSSKGVNASHCRSDTSMNLLVFHTSRNCSFVAPVFSM